MLTRVRQDNRLSERHCVPSLEANVEVMLLKIHDDEVRRLKQFDDEVVDLPNMFVIADPENLVPSFVIRMVANVQIPLEVIEVIDKSTYEESPGVATISLEEFAPIVDMSARAHSANPIWECIIGNQVAFFA